MKTQSSRRLRLVIGSEAALARRKGTLVLCLVFCALRAGLSASAQSPKATIITFDAPGAGTSVSQDLSQGTEPEAINPAGEITGVYIDSSDVFHGFLFLRARDGTITSIDAPGAGTDFIQGTHCFSINPAGAIAGAYLDVNYTFHGFLRAPDGTFTVFDAPGAGPAGTLALNINPAGAIAGYYFDASNISHGFVRTPDGTITTFDAPGAGSGPGQGTLTAGVDGLNPAGAIAGYYLDANTVYHSYVRAPGGAITTFDAPSAGTGAFEGTTTSGITPGGEVVGMVFDAIDVGHGYVRARDGTITIFDIPAAGTGSGQGTIAENINLAGDITGQYVDASGVNHGFLRAKHGAITTFDAPGAGTASGQGTIPSCNNPTDAVTGFYIDANFVLHGFLRIP